MRGLSACNVLLLCFLIIAMPLAVPANHASAASIEQGAIVAEDKLLNLEPEKFRNKAIEYERNGEPYKALQFWGIVRDSNRYNKDLRKKIDALKTQINSLADEHFKKGQAYFNNNSVNAARKEFLLALNYNPDHKEALEYIKHKLYGDDYTIYEVQKGDTLLGIAAKIYADPSKFFLIMRFNDFDKDTILTIGDRLKLPVLEPLMTKPGPDAEDTQVETEEVQGKPTTTVINVEELLIEANNHFNAKKYQETISIAEKVIAYDKKNKGARHLLNAAYYQMGKLQLSNKKYDEALNSFHHVASNYKDIKAVRANAGKHLADIHYKKGVNFFINEDLNNAIKEWEATLALNPQHAKAKKDIENASGLQRRLMEIK